MLDKKLIDPPMRQAAPAIVHAALELRARLQHRLITTTELPDSFDMKARQDMAGIATSAYLMALALACLKDVTNDPTKLDEVFKQMCADIPAQSAANGGVHSLVDCLAAVCG